MVMFGIFVFFVCLRVFCEILLPGQEHLGVKVLRRDIELVILLFFV